MGHGTSMELLVALGERRGGKNLRGMPRSAGQGPSGELNPPPQINGILLDARP
jgi:hypothetical protein